MKNALVSVYIPNYNYSKYIKKAIESVLNQTYRNTELIIIDDGSTDNSKNIINQYVNNSKVKCIFQKNKGLNISNNIALKISKGDYILRLDADDWLDPNCIEILYNTIKKDKDIGFVFSDYYFVDAQENIIKQVRRHDFKKVKLLDQPAHGACSLIKRKLLLEYGGYSEKFTCQDGFDLWLNFIGRKKILNINLPLFYYRQHSVSLSSNEKRILYTRSKIFSKYSKGISKKLNVVAIIPIRGEDIDSSSVVFKKLNKKYIIDYTIESALNAKSIKKILITSPDKKIIKYVEKKYKKNNKIYCLMRKNEMGQINVPLEKTFKSSLSFLKSKNIKVDALMNLIIEFPFRTSSQINSAIDVMKIFKTKQVISIRQENDQFYQHNGNSLLQIQSPNLQLEREELYRQTGNVNLLSVKIINKNIKRKKIGHIIVDRFSSLKIDDNFNFDYAKILSKKYINSK